MTAAKFDEHVAAGSLQAAMGVLLAEDGTDERRAIRRIHP